MAILINAGFVRLVYILSPRKEGEARAPQREESELYSFLFSLAPGRRGRTPCALDGYYGFHFAVGIFVSPTATAARRHS